MGAPVTANQLLDLRSDVGQVGCYWRWKILDQALADTGRVVHPQRVVTMRLDTQATVMRSCTNVVLRESEARDVNLFRDLVRCDMVLEDGTVWPMGVFAFTTDERVEATLETPLSTTLVDLRFALQAELPRAFSVPNNGSVRQAILSVLGIFGVTRHEVHPTDATVTGGPVNWPPGTSGVQVLESLAQRAGFHKPYFDNTGVLVVRPIAPLQAGVGHTYRRDGGRVLLDGFKYSSNLLTAPNAYRVVSAGPTNGEIYGVAFVDPALPFSKEQTGRLQMKTIRRQGLGSTTNCRKVAETFAKQDAGQFATATLKSVVDPRHDVYDLVDVDSTTYREAAWTAVLAPGGEHTHTLVRSLVQEDV